MRRATGRMTPELKLAAEAEELTYGRLRSGLLGEIVTMSLDTLRTNKMRSALTVLGVVIGITSIVGMTSLIRGFDNSLRESISQLGPDTIMVQKWGALSLSGRARASSRSRAAPTCRERMRSRSSANARRSRWSTSGSACTATRSPASTTATRRRKRSPSSARRRTGRRSTSRSWRWAGCSCPPRSIIAARWSCSGRRPWESLFPNIDPIGKMVRIGGNEFTVIGVLGKRPSPGGFSTGADDFAVIPFSAHEKFYGKVLKGSAKISANSFNPAVFRTAMIADRPARRHARRGDARGRGADAHPPQAQSRTAERFRPRRPRTRC